MNKAPAEEMGQATQEQDKAAPDTPKSAQMNSENEAASENKVTPRNRTAQSEQHKVTAKHPAMTRTERSKASRTAEERNRMSRQNTAARSERNDLKGLQGDASGTKVQLSNEQRDQIRTTVLNGGNAPRAANVDFDVTVETAIPHGFRVVPVPATLVRIESGWRGFLYFISGRSCNRKSAGRENRRGRDGLTATTAKTETRAADATVVSFFSLG